MSHRPNQHLAIAVIDVGDCQTAAAQQIAGRYASRRLGGQTLPHRIARRLSESTRLDRVVISGTSLPTALLRTGISAVDVLELPFGHLCERLAAVADRSRAEWIAYVPGNRPFVDPALIDCLLNRAFQCGSTVDYVGFCGTDGGWNHVGHLGVAGEVIHADALRRLRRNIDRIPDQSSHVCLADWLKNAPGQYELQFVQIPSLLDQPDLRFAIENEGDWECAEMFSETVGNDSTEWQTLTDLVRDNRQLRYAMGQRNQVESDV